MMAGAQVAPPTLREQTEVLKRHHELSVVIHGEKAASRMMRKFGIKFSVHHPDPDTVRQDFIRCSSTQDWLDVLVRHYDPSIASILTP